jgi:hypothetical protein
MEDRSFEIGELSDEREAPPKIAQASPPLLHLSDK